MANTTDPYKGDNPIQQWIYDHTLVGHSVTGEAGKNLTKAVTGSNDLGALSGNFLIGLTGALLILVGVWALVGGGVNVQVSPGFGKK